MKIKSWHFEEKFFVINAHCHMVIYILNEMMHFFHFHSESKKWAIRLPNIQRPTFSEMSFSGQFQVQCRLGQHLYMFY